jgi:hypothetical protein
MSTKNSIIILSILFIIAIIGILTFSYIYIWSPKPVISPARTINRPPGIAEQSLSQEEKIKQMTDTLVDMASTTSEAVMSETEAKIKQMSETMSQMVPETSSQDIQPSQTKQTKKIKTMSDIMKQMAQ